MFEAKAVGKAAKLPVIATLYLRVVFAAVAVAALACVAVTLLTLLTKRLIAAGTEAFRIMYPVAASKKAILTVPFVVTRHRNSARQNTFHNRVQPRERH